MNDERDLFISWLHNNEERSIPDDTIVLAVELYDEGCKTVEELKNMLRKAW